MNRSGGGYQDRPGSGDPDGTATAQRGWIRPYLGRTLEPEDGQGPPTGHAGLRPYLLTSGRTGADMPFAIETQVVSTPEGQHALGWLNFEYKDIVAVCAEPLAIAEIGARLSLHLGVVKVLVGDLQQHGLLSVYEPTVDASSDVETILRVIRGLREIC